MAKKSKKQKSSTADQLGVQVGDLLRAPAAPVRLADIDPRSTPGGPKDRAAAQAQIAEWAPRLADLQERLHADARDGAPGRILLVVQGMDTSGKGGVMKHVIGQLEPVGVELHAFKAPSAEEKKHDFLWRFRSRLPTPGQITVFDRSYYEEVLIVRVHDLVPRSVWGRRYRLINRFEEQVADSGTTIIKVMLHISKDEQKQRLLDRLSDPTKLWKYNPGDVDERMHWDAYMTAYEALLDKTNTDIAPWYVVPADRKWYRNWAISKLLLEHLERINPVWPPPGFDVEA
jgi:PPK2 family polyphosphate:nucleotide phosphotransferase